MMTREYQPFIILPKNRIIANHRSPQEKGSEKVRAGAEKPLLRRGPERPQGRSGFNYQLCLFTPLPEP